MVARQSDLSYTLKKSEFIFMYNVEFIFKEKKRVLLKEFVRLKNKDISLACNIQT